MNWFKLPSWSGSTLSRRFASATVQLTLSSVLVRLLALLTMPILTRLLAPESYGLAAMITTSLTLVSVVALAGIDMSYARSFFSAQPPNGVQVESFAWRYALGATAFAAVLSGIVWWQLLAAQFRVPQYLGALLALGVVLNVLNTMAQTRSRLNAQYRRMAVALLIAGVLAAATSVSAASFWRTDELPLILAIFVSYLVPVFVLGLPSPRSLFSPSGLNAGQRATVLKIGLAGIVTAPMYWILSSLDLWFLEHFEGSASVGIYAVGGSVALMGSIVSSSIQSVWLPEASREYALDPVAAQHSLGQLAESLIAGMALVWLAITAAGGDMVRLLSGPNFHTAAQVVPFFAAGMFFNGVSHLASGGLLLRNKLQDSIWCWSLAALLSLALNAWLVPQLGRLGAGITQTCAFGFAALAMCICSQRRYRLNIRVGRLAVVMAAVVLLGFLMFPDWSPGSPIMSMLLKMPLGLAASLAVLGFISPQTLRALSNRFLRLNAG